MKPLILIVITLNLTLLGAMPSVAHAQGDKGNARIAEEAFIYGFPMVMNYAVFYEHFVDKSSSQYKAPFNHITTRRVCIRRRTLRL